MINRKQIFIEYYRRKDNDFLIDNIKNIIDFVLLIDDYKYKTISEIIAKYNTQFSTKLICFSLTLLFNNKILRIVNLNNSYIYY